MSEPTSAVPEISLQRLTGELPVLSKVALQPVARTQLDTLVPSDIPVQLLHFFPHNHNEQDERTFRGECESLFRFGMVDPCLVRPFDEKDLAQNIGETGAFEMIDGEHRTRALVTWMERPLPEGAHQDLVSLCERQVVPCLVQPMSRAWAARLRVVLSETRGRANAVKLGKVLSELVAEVGLEELRVGTPWSVEHVREIVEVGRFDWDAFEREAERRRADTKADTGVVRMTIEVPRGKQDEFNERMRPLVDAFGLRLKVKK